MLSTHRYALDFDHTMDYFVDHINSERTLSTMLINRINFKEGFFFTLLPSSIESSKLYEFSHGGILPRGADLGKMNFKGLGNFNVETINSVDDDAAKFIHAFLKEKQSHSCVIESYNPTPTSPHVQIKNVDMIPYMQEVYYFLYERNSEEELLKTIQDSHTVWHFLAILADLKKAPKDHLSEYDLDQICEHSKYIVAGAYDREGYIFWEKK